MNAHALLTAQGWRGKGHSLHKTDDAIGLSNPLLLSRKDDTKGLGGQQHFTSDQWWMNAFDEQLKGLDTSEKGRVSQTVTTGKLNSIEKGSLGKYYLYASFVSGGLLQGTISGEQDGQDETATTSLPSTDTETKEERRARKELRRRKREARAKEKTERTKEKSEQTKEKAERTKKSAEGREARASAKAESRSKDADDKYRRRARKEEKRRQTRKERSRHYKGH